VRRGFVPKAVGALGALLLAAAGLLAPLDVRHSAPFGFSLTVDARRGIAVSGGFVEPNYPNFDRIDLDLRAYDVEADYDLTVHVRPDRPGAPDVRTLPLSVPGSRIRHDKPAFADPFVTLRFPPIERSAGQRYYVWVERGPRNRDDVVALWSIKSYSRVDGAAVLAAFLRGEPGDERPIAAQAILTVLLVAFVAAFGWLLAAVVAAVASALRAPPGDGGPVADPTPEWYTVQRFARRPRRRVVAFRGRPSPRPSSAPNRSIGTRHARQGRD